MKASNLNQWLTLAANIGVLIGIVVIVVELQQTQTAMLAGSSTTRAQMQSENASIIADNRFREISAKAQAGETLTSDEIRDAQEVIDRMLRYFENLYYLNRIGVLDEEIWDSAARGMRGIRQSPIFNTAHPNFSDGGDSSRYAESFISFIES